MLESLRRASVFTFQNLKPYKTLNPELTTLNPENLKSKLLRVVSVFIHPLVTGCVIWDGRTWGSQGTCFLKKGETGMAPGRLHGAQAKSHLSQWFPNLTEAF